MKCASHMKALRAIFSARGSALINLYGAGVPQTALSLCLKYQQLAFSEGMHVGIRMMELEKVQEKIQKHFLDLLTAVMI